MKVNNCTLICFLLSLGISFFSCEEKVASAPKPRMFPRVHYPQKGMAAYSSSTCPFTFRYGAYNQIVKDSFIFEGKPVSDCWFDVNAKELNASLHCSYYDSKDKKSIGQHIEDAFRIASNHNSRANFRKEDKILNKYGVKGLMFNIDGPVASPIQFYLTDEKAHFFRASLYFNAKVNPDSTAAILAYLRPDIDSMIATFQWKK